MTIEHLPTWLLETGDVIRVRHEHDSRCGDCLARRETDAAPPPSRSSSPPSGQAIR